MQRRREFIAGIASATTLVAGCSGGNDADGGTSASPAGETTTAEPRTLRGITPVATWKQQQNAPGDEMTGFGRGANAVFAVEARTAVGDRGRGELDATAVVYDDSGTEYARKTVTTRSGQTDAVDTATWTSAFQFNTGDFSTGSYRAEVTATDAVSGADLGTVSTPFDVRHPLGPGEIEVVDKLHPETVSPGESFSYGLRVRNVSDSDNSVVSDQSIRVDDGSFRSLDAKVGINVPADGIGVARATDVSLPEPGTYTYRFDAIDVTFQVEATS